MKQIIRLSIIFFITGISFSCVLKKSLPEQPTIITPLGNELSIREGSIVYGLPLTVLRIKVEMNRTIEKPGPYSKYAEDLLGLKDAIMSESEFWSIEKVSVEPSAELDPSEFYVIESSALFETNVLRLKEEGFILDLNPEIYNKPGDITATGESTGLESLSFRDLGSNEYYHTQRDTAFRLVNYDASFVKIPYLVEKKKKLTEDQLAEKAARTILELRDGKHLILTGEANVFPQSSAAIDEINRLDREYTELFTGKTFHDKAIFTYTIIPRKDRLSTPEMLFRFSELTGPSDVSGTAGVPVLVELKPAPKNKNLTVIVKPLLKGEETERQDKLYYRVPEVVNVNIKIGDKTLYSGRNLVFQFGNVVQLPANYLIGN
jgi:hypothetical protein